MARFGIPLALALLVFPRMAWGGAAFGGMGGVGIGIADPSGDLSVNPATAAADLRSEEGVARVGMAWERLTFAGSAYNRDGKTVSVFTIARNMGWSFVTPALTANGGRAGFGSWQVSGRGLEVDEPLDLSLPLRPGLLPLSASYFKGTTELKQRESLDVVGAVWIQPIGARLSQFAVGAGYASLAAHGTVKVTGIDPVYQYQDSLARVASRKSLTGPVVMAGFFYRPVREGSIGIGLLYTGAMRGKVWEQSEGGPLYMDTLSRPAQLRVGLGGFFTVIQGLNVAVDLEFAGENRPKAGTLFAGTGAARSSSEYSDATFALRAGMEYQLRFWDFDIPVRTGFFTSPDPLPASTVGLGASSVADFRPVSFKQDVTGVTFGTGWSSKGLRADVALMWLMVTTHVKLAGAAGTVDSGDVRSSLGAVGSVALVFKHLPFE
jgi:hypothetical protein